MKQLVTQVTENILISLSSRHAQRQMKFPGPIDNLEATYYKKPPPKIRIAPADQRVYRIEQRVRIAREGGVGEAAAKVSPINKDVVTDDDPPWQGTA
jgi:hypothetical protein